MRKVSGRWTVELNADSIPRLKINQQYAAMGNSARNDADGQFIRSNLQEARWLIKSLESRNDTPAARQPLHRRAAAGFFRTG
ncbi:RNA polymerase sigma-54 factor RpoN [Klebsiella pneumoniae subsp. pneumoniae]|nr:RNA polymerase sigma-54 factor RpoN [Klebsiella pneumoniae subsp. pneumoniae]